MSADGRGRLGLAVAAALITACGAVFGIHELPPGEGPEGSRDTGSSNVVHASVDGGADRDPMVDVTDGGDLARDGGADERSADVAVAGPEASAAADDSERDAVTSDARNSADAPDASEPSDSSVALERADAAGDDGSFVDVAEGSAASSLAGVQPDHLQLWLASDRGVVCSGTDPSRATLWRDGSPHHRDATAVGHLGPQCGVPGHALNGIPVLYFSAPPQDARKNVDETLDLPSLDFLTAVEFTVFIVERRWVDVGRAYFLFGTPTTTATPPASSALQLGYVDYNGVLQLTFDFTYFGTQSVGLSYSSASGPSPAQYDMFRFSFHDGLQLYINGHLAGWNISVDNQTRALALSPGGTIGRALNPDMEYRYDGDIGEIIAFDAALSDGDRLEVEAYLQARWAQPFAPPL